ncbi:tetratricopeptide repeat protein [Edaphobacter paludis]|uniref:Tetratricopeptide repeat protein n=1 Tax=Edaphobacter paludis TaxID=3035702 RepID=A0AAU7D7S0_9BACT
MSRKAWCRRAILCPMLVWATFAAAEDNPQQKLDRQFQSAVAHYDAGQLPEAAAELEDLLPHVSNNFEAQELLGLIYASMSDDAKAIVHLEAAVRLKPNSAPARTNLAASLSRSGSPQLAGEQLQKALTLAPHEYTTNHNLGEFYIKSGKISEARPLLARAQRIDPSSYDNGYDLATADLLTGQLAEARELVQSLLQKKNTGELHNLLAQIEEKDGQFVAAANEFETAAHMDPSEDNLFDWASELLLHRTYEPAIEVFRSAAQRYPNSPRLMIGLGMSLYARGLYEDAVKALLTAADLNPSDPRCYLFLSKSYDSSPSQADEVIQRFRRYAALEPNNALAQYYYAMSLWKGKRAEGSGLNFQEVESLLKKSIALNGSIPEAHMQLGNLYADQRQFEKSIPEYVRALELNPNLPDAHYRLGTDYVHIGQKDRAQTEFAVYQKLRAQHMAEVDKERAEVKQFVYSSKPAPSAKP